MGGRPPAPRVEYIPAPPPPVTVSTPTQSLRTQTELTKATGEQTRLNMETGAQLDRINEEFYTGQDLRRYRARGAEERLLSETRGQQERLTTGERGKQERLTVGERGSQTRQTQAQLLSGQERQIGLRGTEERATTRTRGEEQRAGIRESGSETRRTALQQEQFRRYKEDRDFRQSRQAYKS